MPRRNILEVSIEDLTEADIIYDWNAIQRRAKPAHKVEFFDETLRDGIQSPSVVDPPIERKLAILRLMDQMGIDYVETGLPGAGPRAKQDVTAIVREIRDAKLSIKPAAAGRTVVADLEPMVDISQELGVELEAMTFIGSSTIRLYAEQWNLDKMLKLSADAVGFCRKNNLPCTYVTEDTTRSHPEVLEPLFLNAIEHGAHRLCICDTVGHATPDGVKALVEWTRELLDKRGAKHVKLDWHGHNDRGLGVENTLWAAEFGVNRVHGTALGIGERVGNASLDQVLVNMKLLGWIDNDLSQLVAYCRLVAEATEVPVPVNYPLVGDDAFRTATGVHAAAIIKAQRRGDAFLADRVYSGVPASMFGKEQEVAVGPMSGESNIAYWLSRRGIDADDALTKRIFAQAKASDRLLTDEEIWEVIHDHRGEHQRT